MNVKMEERMEKKITKELEGQIEDKTNDSIKIGKVWIKFFDKDKLKEIYEDDNVKVIYRDNEKNGKTYHNGISIELKPRAITIKELTSDPKQSKEKDQKVIPDSTLNTLLMSIKEVYLENSVELSYPEATRLVLDSYEQIKRLY